MKQEIAKGGLISILRFHYFYSHCTKIGKELERINDS